MNIADIIFIIIIIIGIYIGYNSGFYKRLNDTILLFISSYLSNLITNLFFDKIIIYLPFFNLDGASQGIKSINIIIYYVLIYLIIMILLILMISFIEDKIGIKAKILDQIVSMKKIGCILGSIMSVPFIILFIFNLIIILGLPIFNKSWVFESKISEYIMDNVPLLSEKNASLYSSEILINDKINDNNTIETYKEINNEITMYIIENNIIKQETVEQLNKSNKLEGIKTKNIVVEKHENQNNDDNNNNNNDSEYNNNSEYNDDSPSDYEDPTDDYDDDNIDTEDDIKEETLDDLFKDEYYFDEDADVL